MSIDQINGRGLNDGPLNGPPPTYVNASATMTHGHTVTSDAQVYDLYVEGSTATPHDHTLTADARVTAPWKVPLNSRGLNSHQTNGLQGLYVNGRATLTTAHTFGGDLTLGFDTYVYASAVLTHPHTLPADLTFFQNYYVDGASTFEGHGHSLSGDLTFFYSTIVYGDAVMTHGHTITADLTFAYEFFVNGTASLSHGHSLDSAGQTVIQGSSALNQDHTLSGDLTFGSDIVVYGAVAFTHDHTFEGDFKLYDPVDASINLVTNHTFGGDLTLLPYVDGAATLTHDHDLEWTDTQSVLASATLTHSHVIYATALGGTPGIDTDPLWWAAEPLLDIEARSTTNRKTQQFGFTYDVDGFNYWLSGTNYCTINTAPIDAGCSTYPEPDISGELGMVYGLGETQWSMDMQWSYMFDVDEQAGSLDMKYDLDVTTQSLQKGTLHMKGALWGKTELEALLVLVNDARTDLGLVPYTLYIGAGEDVAQTHSQNMAEAGIFAHDDPGFPVGYQSEAERITHIQESPTGYGENLAATTNSVRHMATAAELFNAWWNSPQHKANILYPWTVGDNPQMLLGYGFRYDWSGAPGLWTTFYTQLFISYGIPAGATLAEGQLNITYQLDTSLVSALNVGYALDAYTQAQRQHSSVYGLSVAAQHELSYGAGVAQQHTTPIHYILQTQHESGYSGLEYLWTQHEVGYNLALYTPVLQQNEHSYNVSVAAANGAVFSYLQPLQTQHEAGYELLQYTPVLNSSANPYAINVGAQHELTYTAYDYVRDQHESPYEPSVLVNLQNEHGYNVLSYNPVLTAQTLYYSMIDSTVTVTTDYATLTVKGVSMEVAEAVVSMAEGDYAWNASIILTDLANYQLISRGDEAILDIYGETYTLQVESKSLSRSGPAEISMRIEALSPSIKHRNPDATPVNYENTTSVFAKDAVETVLGESVDWQVLNWPIPAYRIRAEDAEPIVLAQEIVNSIGAVIESKRDGTLLVRNSFKVNIPNYATAVPDHVYTDIEHNLSVSEEYTLRPGYNKFLVLEDVTGLSDTLEWVPNEDIATGGVLRAYPNPWRTSIQITHTDGASVSLTPLGTQTRQETEIVEFVAGSASLGFPAISLDTITWKSSPLTGVALEVHSSTITSGTSVNQGYGVAEITYTVESIDYESSAPIGSVVQYLIEDLG